MSSNWYLKVFWSLYQRHVCPIFLSIANVIKQAGCPVPDYMMGLKKIKGYESFSFHLDIQWHAMEERLHVLVLLYKQLLESVSFQQVFVQLWIHHVS